MKKRFIVGLGFSTIVALWLIGAAELLNAAESAERSLRQAMVLSNGNVSIFFARPISAGLLIVTLGLLLTPFVFRGRKSV